MEKMRNKMFWFCLLLLIGLPTWAFAATTTLRWQANSEPDISGYHVYYGTASRTYKPPIPVGKTTSYEVSGLEDGRTYYYALTAVDSSGNESGYSTEVSARAASSDPTTEPYQLVLSTSSSHSNPVSLSGRTISGNAYIFVLPEAYVSQVVFAIDGKTHNTENYAPYDLGNPFDTRDLSNGAHTISARIVLQDNSVQNLSATVNASNSTSGTSTSGANQPNKVRLTRSPSGKPTEGTIFTFTASASGGSGNYQYKFMEKGPATNNVWVVARNYATSSSFAWNSTGKAGKTQIQAWARNVGSSIDQKPKKVKTIKIKVVKPNSAGVSEPKIIEDQPATTSSSWWFDEPGGK